jgi:hypothetical protein
VQDELKYVLLGLGTAGSTVLGRLSEIPEWSILGLEKGPETPSVFAPDFNLLPANYG